VTPFTCQRTPVLEVPVTVAVNWTVAPRRSLDCPATATEMVGVGGPLEKTAPVHPARSAAAVRKRSEEQRLRERGLQIMGPPHAQTKEPARGKNDVTV
jgi:hypothetical protein